MIGGIISLILAVILVASFSLPVVRTGDTLTTTSESLVYANTSNNQTFTLANTPTSASLSIVGLTLTDNYTVDYTAGTVKVLDGTVVATYSSTYSYEGSTYLTNTTERTLWSIMGLAFIIGLLMFVFVTFGVI